MFGNIGNVFYEQKRYYKARRFYIKTFILLRSTNYPEELYECYNNFGAVYLKLGNPIKAVFYLQKALNKLIKLGRKKSVDS